MTELKSNQNVLGYHSQSKPFYRNCAQTLNYMDATVQRLQRVWFTPKARDAMEAYCNNTMQTGKIDFEWLAGTLCTTWIKDILPKYTYWTTNWHRLNTLSLKKSHLRIWRPGTNTNILLQNIVIC